MSYTISMDRAGRIVIPKDIRAQLGADERTAFNIEVVLGRIELTPTDEPQQGTARLVQKGSAWVIAGTGQPPISVVEAIQQERNEHLRPHRNPSESLKPQ